MDYRVCRCDLRLKPVTAHEDEPTISDGSEGIQDAPAPLHGIAIFRDKEQVAVISLVNWDETIWLKNNLNDVESEMLLGIGHSLILSNWLDDSN